MNQFTKSTTIIFISVITLSLIITTGCGMISRSQNSGQMETYNYQQGSDALLIEFLEGMPPKQMFIGTEFSTALKVKNNGAYDIQDRAELKISVPDRSAFRFDENDAKPIDLRGKSLYLKEGDEDMIIFPMKALCFPGYDGTRASIVKNYTRRIKATACYYYQTTANKDICIDTMKFSRAQSDKAECDMKTISLSGGQGGPVGVTSITPQIIPKSETQATLQLSITIDKLKGTDFNIYAPNAECNKPEEQNKVDISVEIGGTTLNCEPSSITLKERSTVSTICKKDMPISTGAYLTPIAITMKYYVQQSVFKEVTVEPPPGTGIFDCTRAESSTSSTSSTSTGSTSSGGNSCSSTHPGYSCKTVSCNTGEDINSCASRYNCYRGLCPGGETNICCP